MTKSDKSENRSQKVKKQMFFSSDVCAHIGKKFIFARVFRHIKARKANKNKLSTHKHNMEIKGKVIQVMPLQSGTSQRTGNAWRKQDYLMETYDRFPRKIYFGFFGDAIDQYPLQAGDDINLSFDLESRSYVGRDGVERWSTDVRAWKAEKIDPSMIQAQMPYAQPAPTGVPQFPAAPAPAQPYAQPAMGAASDPMADSAAPNASEDLPF